MEGASAFDILGLMSTAGWACELHAPRKRGPLPDPYSPVEPQVFWVRVGQFRFAASSLRALLSAGERYLRVPVFRQIASTRLSPRWSTFSSVGGERTRSMTSGYRMQTGVVAPRKEEGEPRYHASDESDGARADANTHGQPQDACNERSSESVSSSSSNLSSSEELQPPEVSNADTDVVASSGEDQPLLTQ